MNPIDENQHLPRRTVTTAMAWSLPVIALAVATPLAAASTSEGVEITGPDSVSGELASSQALVFTVTDGGADVASGVLSITLNDTDALAFDPDADGYSSATTATVDISDGVAVAVVILNGAGTATGAVAFGGYSTSFATPVVIE